MGAWNRLALLVSLSAAVGCGGSPSSPSSGAGTSSLQAEAAVVSAMSQAMRQVAIVGPTTGDAQNTFTMPCTSGGSMIITVGGTLPPQAGPVRTSSRIEYRDCRNQGVTLNGDPYLETTAEHSFPALTGLVGDSQSTIWMTGGMRIDAGGVQGRVQFNCTTTMAVRPVNGSPPQITSTASGTITFEQPLGSTPVVRPCGPA